MIVALTGGTGFVGQEVLRRLVEAGHRPRLLVRRPRSESRRSPVPPPVAVETVVVGDWTADGLASALRDADAVIHLVGIIAEVGHQTYERVHVGLTAEVLKAAVAAGGRRFVHMSALGTRPGARSRYHRTKWAAEERVRASGLDWTIFRPSLIYGEHDAFTRFFARMSAWSPLLPVFGGGRNLMQPIAVTEVARAFVGALSLPNAVGRTYDLCGPEAHSFRDLLTAILAANGRRRWLVPVPFPLARLQARFLEVVCGRLLGVRPPLNRDQVLMLEEDNVGDGTPADRDFGLVHERFGTALGRWSAGSSEASGPGP